MSEMDIQQNVLLVERYKSYQSYYSRNVKCISEMGNGKRQMAYVRSSF